MRHIFNLLLLSSTRISSFTQKKFSPIRLLSRPFAMSPKADFNNDPPRHVDEVLLPKGFLKERTRVLTDPDLSISDDSQKSVFYWMQRDVRTVDNWSLLLAAHLASVKGQTLRVGYVLPPPPAKEQRIPSLVNLPNYERHASFLLDGLKLVHHELKDMKIPLHVVKASSHDEVGEAVVKEMNRHNVSAVVGDFSPIRQYREWMEIQAKPLLNDKKIPFFQVDAHNVVPVWITSEKREYAARTIRPKIHNHLDKFLQDIPELSSPNKGQKGIDLPDFERKSYEDHMKIDRAVKPVDWAKAGNKNAMKKFESFCKESMDDFGQLRNDPNEDVCSNLSPWINHGHVSAQRLTKLVDEMGRESEGVDSYIEESVVRRELAENFVFFSPHSYDSLDGANDWAKKTLKEHKDDEREYVYSLKEFEEGTTHEDVWNAAQIQLVQEGHMHGFMRMYWSKKVRCEK